MGLKNKEKCTSTQKQKGKHNIYTIRNYDKANATFINTKGLYTDDIDHIKNCLEDENGYHFRVFPNNQYIFYGDLDGYEGGIMDFANKLNNFLEKYYGLSFEDSEFMYTINDSKDFSYHYSIPKWNATAKKLKEIHENLKLFYPEFSDKSIGKDYVDTSVYTSHWYRCPNQHKGLPNDKTLHVITVGEIEDFIITYIPDYSTNIDNVDYKKNVLTKNTTKKEIKIDYEIETHTDTQIVATNDNTKLTKHNGKFKQEDLILSKTMTQPTVLKKVMDCYKQCRSDKYEYWIAVGMALKNTFPDEKVAFDLFDYFSSKGIKYEGPEKTHQRFNTFVTKKTENGYTIATIYYYAIEDDKPKFIEVMKKNSFDLEQYDLCKYASILAGNTYIYVKTGDLYKLYCYNGKYWENNDVLFRQFISTELYDFLKVMLVELYFDDNSFNHMRSQIKKLKTSKFKDEMVKTYKEVNTKDDIKFDDKWNLLGFKNLVYDLEKDEFRKYEYSDYVSTTTGYDWREPTNEESNTINLLIKQIMPDEKERELYLQILATALDGRCLEKFVIFNGSGGNGKGMINDLMLHALGDYAMIGNNSILFETSKTGSNPEKANMHKKRLVIFREPPETKKFENSVVKELTGGGTFSARGHHESTTKKELNLTMIVEANKRPLFAEEPTQADVRRIIDVYFRSSFTENKDVVNNENYVFLANSFYKSSEFQSQHKFALMKILFDAYKKYKLNNYILQIPKTIEERTRQYVEMSCNILQWFKDNYEFTGNKDDICKMKDLYDDFSGGIYFLNLTKNEKRKYNKTYFNDFVIGNAFFIKYHKQVHKNIKNCIVGWKKLEGENDE